MAIPELRTSALQQALTCTCTCTYTCVSWVLINTRRACAARVTLLGLCVCLSALILALRVTRRSKSDTNRFSATLAWFLWFSWNRVVQKLWREKERKSQYAIEYCLTLTALCRFAHCESIKSYSKAKSWVKGCTQTLPTNTATQWEWETINCECMVMDYTNVFM